MADVKNPQGDLQPAEERPYRLLALVRGDALARPEKKPEDTVMTFPHLVIIEVLAALLVSVILLGLSLLRNAPLEDIANPEMPPHVAKAAWYLVGLQEMLLHMDPLLGGIILPGLVVLGLMAIPYIDRVRMEGEAIWFTSRKGKRIVIVTALATAIVVPLSIFLSEQLNMIAWPLPILITNFLIPLVAILAQMVVLGVIIKLVFKANTREVLLSLFTAVLVTWVIITILGQLLRGPGMKFYWPWQPWPVE